METRFVKVGWQFVIRFRIRLKTPPDGGWLICTFYLPRCTHAQQTRVFIWATTATNALQSVCRGSKTWDTKQFLLCVEILSFVFLLSCLSLMYKDGLCNDLLLAHCLFCLFVCLFCFGLVQIQRQQGLPLQKSPPPWALWSMLQVRLCMNSHCLIMIDKHYLQWENLFLDSVLSPTYNLWLLLSPADGVALGAAASTSQTSVQLIVFVAIMLHKVNLCHLSSIQPGYILPYRWINSSRSGVDATNW